MSQSRVSFRISSSSVAEYIWYNHTMQTSDISYRNSVTYSIYVRNHTQETKPSLFDIDVFDRNGKDISSEIAQLVTMKKSLPTDAVFQAKLTGRNTVEASYYSDNKTIVSREFALPCPGQQRKMRKDSADRLQKYI